MVSRTLRSVSAVGASAACVPVSATPRLNSTTRRSRCAWIVGRPVVGSGARGTPSRRQRKTDPLGQSLALQRLTAEFKRLATRAQEMLRLGRALDEALFVLGQATHFVQDLNQPLHAAWGETRAEHNEIEAQMLYRDWQKDHRYRGFILIKNYTCFAFEIAQNSSQHARALFFDREIKRVTEIAWDQAVNDTARSTPSKHCPRIGTAMGVWGALCDSIARDTLRGDL